MLRAFVPIYYFFPILCGFFICEVTREKAGAIQYFGCGRDSMHHPHHHLHHQQYHILRIVIIVGDATFIAFFLYGNKDASDQTKQCHDLRHVNVAVSGRRKRKTPPRYVIQDLSSLVFAHFMPLRF